MANKVSDKMVKAFERFNADLKAFGEETGETFVTLYEDAFTTRRVANFRLYKNGNLKWIEIETGQLSQENVEQVYDDDDANDWLKFWRANLRRAKRYWGMNTETLDKIQDGEHWSERRLDCLHFDSECDWEIYYSPSWKLIK